MEYFGTLKECRESIEKDVTVLVEEPIYSSETGKIDSFLVMVERKESNIDKYAIVRYHIALRRPHHYMWYGSYENAAYPEERYLDAKSFIMLLVKRYFKEEHKRIVGCGIGKWGFNLKEFS